MHIYIFTGSIFYFLGSHFKIIILYFEHTFVFPSRIRLPTHSRSRRLGYSLYKSKLLCSAKRAFKGKEQREATITRTALQGFRYALVRKKQQVCSSIKQLICRIASLAQCERYVQATQRMRELSDSVSTSTGPLTLAEEGWKGEDGCRLCSTVLFIVSFGGLS